MFCPKCGQELIPQTRFCAHCGADIQSLLQQAEEVPSTSQENTPKVHEPQKGLSTPDASMQETPEAQPPEIEPKVQETVLTETGSIQSSNGGDPLATAVGKNQAYYLPESQKIRVGEKSRFNRAAFYAVVILSVVLIGVAGTIAIRHQYSAIFESDTPGRFDMSDIQGSLTDTSRSSSHSIGLPSGDAHEFDDVIGLWENENGNGDTLYIFYEDETAQRAYAEVSTDETYFVVELTRPSGESIHGVLPETQDSSACEIDLSWIGNAFDATIYHDEYFVDYITFVPSELNEFGYQEPSYANDYGFDALTGIWEDEGGNGLYLMIGYADETKQRAFARVLTVAAEFDVELRLTSEDSAEGNVMGYGSEPLYAISVSRYKYWLEANIYYNEYGFEDYIKFVPADLLTCPYENPFYVPWN